MTTSSTDRSPVAFNFFLGESGNPTVSQVRLGHYSSDPTVVSHCPFCGSGGVVGRSDGTIECTICGKALVVMEQPLHTFMPSAEQGAAVKTNGSDPLAQEEAFHDPDSATPPPGQSDPGADPAGDAAGAPSGDESGGGLPPFITARVGRRDVLPPYVKISPESKLVHMVQLHEDDFVLMHAARALRGS